LQDWIRTSSVGSGAFAHRIDGFVANSIIADLRAVRVTVAIGSAGLQQPSDFRDVLRCIRCGTCMLECPAYRHISGHGYGTLYPGPLGLALVPVLAGYRDYAEVTRICSLCSACNDVCPVKIPLYQSIYEHRRIIAEDKHLVPQPEPFVMGLYGWVIGSSSLYDSDTKLAKFSSCLPRVGPLKEWTRERELPEISGRRFRDWFKKSKSQGGGS